MSQYTTVRSGKKQVFFMAFWLISMNALLEYSPVAAQGKNPSISEDVARVLVCNLVLLLATAPQAKETLSISGPIDLPGAILIPGDRPLIIVGEPRFSGEILLPAGSGKISLPSAGDRGKLEVRGRILVTGSITIPRIDYGPVLDNYGVLVFHGPFTVADLAIPAQVTAPGASVDAAKVSAPLIAGKVKIEGPVTRSTVEGGKNTLITIKGPITFEGPITIALISYGPYTADTWGAMSNPGPLTVTGPIILSGEILVEGPIAWR